MKAVRDQDNGVINVELDTVGDQPAPCPFCGGRAGLHHTWTASYWLECGECGAEMHDTGRIGSHDSKAAHLASARRVVRTWNRRAS